MAAKYEWRAQDVQSKFLQQVLNEWEGEGYEIYQIIHTPSVIEGMERVDYFQVIARRPTGPEATPGLLEASRAALALLERYHADQQAVCDENAERYRSRHGEEPGMGVAVAAMMEYEVSEPPEITALRAAIRRAGTEEPEAYTPAEETCAYPQCNAPVAIPSNPAKCGGYCIYHHIESLEMLR